MTSRLRKLFLRTRLALALMLGLAALQGPAPAVPAAASPDVVLAPVATGLDRPVAIAHAGDGSGRLFIVLQPGQIVIYDGTQILPTPFLDISALVSCCGERGLLSVAFHPQYPVSGYFYVNYTDLQGDTVVARYQVSSDPNVADPASAATLLSINQPFSNHNGGQLQFGPDGYLYVAVGDGGSSGDPQNNGQNRLALLGKILRIDVDGGPPYAIPADNPFVGDPEGLDEIWAWGLRNPWRFSFDRLTGDLLIADVGQNAWEEVDFQPASSAGGENYGWRLMEGSHCYNPSVGCNDGTLTLPILEYAHTDGNCSVTGGYRYRGTQVPDLDGVYVYGDYCSGRVWGAAESGGNWAASELRDTPYLISSFGEDEAGELYLAHLSSNGTVFRILPATGDADGDGCSNAEELGPDPTLGGGRNPLNPYDFYDITDITGALGSKDQGVSGFDLNLLLAWGGARTGGGPNPNGRDYDADTNGNTVPDGAELDFAGIAGPATGPDGGISGFDLAQMLSEGGASCSAPP